MLHDVFELVMKELMRTKDSFGEGAFISLISHHLISSHLTYFI